MASFPVTNGQASRTGRQPVGDMPSAVQNAASQRVDPRTFGAVGNGVADDHAALAAAVATLQAGWTLDLAGRTYLVGSTLSLNVANVTVQNGTIGCTVAGTPAVQVVAANVTFRSVAVNASYAYGTNWAVSSSSLSALLVNAANFRSYDCNYAGGYLACVFFSHAACNGSKIIRGSTTQNNLAQNSCGIQAAAGGVGNLDITVEDVDVIGAGGAYNSGNPAAANGVLMFDSKRCVVRNCRVRLCTRQPTLTISNGNGSSHGSTALWSLVSGTTWQARLASGTPGVSGPNTDRNDGATRVVKLNGTEIAEDESVPGSPGASKWGESGGFVYYNTSGSGFTDPNNNTFTSDTVSGYGITFYNTANGFIDMSENVVEGNQVYSCDGFGVYMQLGGGPSAGQYCYGTGNRTSNNVLENCCLQGIQTVTLPFAALGYTGGTDSISEGDTIRNTGSAIVAPGFACFANVYLGSARIIGVTVEGNYSQGFSHNVDGGWSYVGCEAKTTSSHGFFIWTAASQTIRNVTLTGCCTTNVGAQGVYVNGTAASSTLQASITGGTHRNAGNCSVRIDGGKDCTVTGVDSNNPGQQTTGQAHYRLGVSGTPCTRCVVTGCHFVNGSSGSVGVQVDTGASDCMVYGNTGAGVTTFLSLAASVIVRISGNDASSTTPGDFIGAGVPTAGGLNFAATIGSTFRNTSGTAGSIFYVNQTGAAAGWLALA